MTNAFTFAIAFYFAGSLHAGTGKELVLRRKLPTETPTAMPTEGPEGAYGTLGLTPTATSQEVTTAYRKLAIQSHTDKNQAVNARAMFEKIKEAYEYIKKGRYLIHLLEDPKTISPFIVNYINRNEGFMGHFITVTETHFTGGWTALHFAAMRNDSTLIKLLIAHGADVNARDDEKNTPLHIAAAMGSSDAVQELMANETIELQAANNTGHTPLATALESLTYIQGQDHTPKQLQPFKDVIQHLTPPAPPPPSRFTRAIAMLVTVRTSANEHISSIWEYIKNTYARLFGGWF